MLEKDIEQKVIDAIQNAFNTAGIDGIQTAGAWQTVDADGLKAHEEIGRGIVTVKVFPRQYATPTIADASLQIEVNLIIRSDMDAGGIGFIETVEVLAALFQKWQHNYENYFNDFNIDGKFQPTGFQQDGGDIGNDSANGVWTYSMTMSLAGIICWNA